MSSTLLRMGKGEAQGIKFQTKIKHNLSTPFLGENSECGIDPKTLGLSILETGKAQNVKLEAQIKYNSSTTFLGENMKWEAIVSLNP